MKYPKTNGNILKYPLKGGNDRKITETAKILRPADFDKAQIAKIDKESYIKKGKKEMEGSYWWK